MKTSKAAAAAGMSPGVFRAHMARLRAHGEDYRLPPEKWDDLRTPEYDARKINAWIKKREADRG